MKSDSVRQKTKPAPKTPSKPKEPYWYDGPKIFGELWDGAIFMVLEENGTPIIDQKYGQPLVCVKLWEPASWTVNRTESPNPIMAVSLTRGVPIHLTPNQRVMVIKS